MRSGHTPHRREEGEKPGNQDRWLLGSGRLLVCLPEMETGQRLSLEGVSGEESVTDFKSKGTLKDPIDS